MHDLPIYLFSKTPHSEVIHIPILSIRYLKPSIDFSRYDAIVITSKETVDALEAIGTAWKHLPVLCVASKTAEKVRQAGGETLETGSGYGEDLAQIILENYPQQRWLYAKPVQAASDFSEHLRHEGVIIDDCSVYETQCNSNADMTVKDEAVLAFTSPSAVGCFKKRFRFMPGHRICVIGKTTLQALPHGLHAQISETPSVDELVALAKRLALLPG